MGRAWTANEDHLLRTSPVSSRADLAVLARKIGRTSSAIEKRAYNLNYGRVQIAEEGPRERVQFWIRRLERNCYVQALVRSEGKQRVETLAAFGRVGTPKYLQDMHVANAMLRRVVAPQSGSWASRNAGPRDLYVPFAYEVVALLPACCVIQGDDVAKYAGRELGGGELLERVRALGLNEHPAGGE